MTNTYRITGLMSGSSLDGVDLAFCTFTQGHAHWEYRITAADTLPYPGFLKDKLEQACHWSPERIHELDLELGEFYATLLNNFHAKYKLVPDLISSHGHTIFHEPRRGITLQVGDGSVMARKTGIKIVNDFRSEDVAQGGEGAPLVPIGDQLLFGTYGGCLNLGGFANFSFQDQEGRRIAYDLCPANMAFNWIAGLEGLAYDRNGEIARTGKPSEKLLLKLNDLDYYRTDPPKSLGKEWYLSDFLPLLKETQLSTVNLMATVSEHIAVQIASGINGTRCDTVLVTGGGALNQGLMERLKNHTKAKMEIPGMELVHFKEALIFAFLGLLRIRGEINCLSSVTGGKQDLCTGTIHYN